jgi:hypothetical protein
MLLIDYKLLDSQPYLKDPGMIPWNRIGGIKQCSLNHGGKSKGSRTKGTQQIQNGKQRFNEQDMKMTNEFLHFFSGSPVCMSLKRLVVNEGWLCCSATHSLPVSTT